MDMGYRIGAVAKLTGISTDTIRAWERRYGVVEPHRGENNNRYYSEGQVQKLINVKRLVDAGQAISTICRLSDEELGERTSGILGVDRAVPVRSGRWGVFSVQQPSWLRACVETQPEVEADWHADLEDMPMDKYGFLVVDMPSLSEANAEEVINRFDPSSARRAVVIYRFAARQQLRALSQHGFRLLKGPLEPFALVNLLGTADRGPKSRRFAEHELQQIMAMESDVVCECPRHVSELIVSLNQFEDYSKACVDQTDQDAALHRKLFELASDARALMEDALDEIISVEGHQLN